MVARGNGDGVREAANRAEWLLIAACGQGSESESLQTSVAASALLHPGSNAAPKHAPGN